MRKVSARRAAVFHSDVWSALLIYVVVLCLSVYHCSALTQLSLRTLIASLDYGFLSVYMQYITQRDMFTSTSRKDLLVYGFPWDLLFLFVCAWVCLCLPHRELSARSEPVAEWFCQPAKPLWITLKWAPGVSQTSAQLCPVLVKV